MGFLRRAMESRSVGAVTTFGPDYGADGAGKWSQGMVWQPWAGAATASTEQAMRLSAVYACLRLLSEAVGTLPLDTFRRRSGVRLPYRPRPQYLNFDPPGTSRITYMTQVMLSLLTDGNAFIATPRVNREVQNLVVLDPQKIEVKADSAGAEPYYIVDKQRYGPLDIRHIAGMMLPGQLRGVSPIRAAREVIDGGLKAQDYGRQFFGNSAVPPAVIEAPSGGGSPEAERERAREIARIWNDTNGGTSNAGKVGVLTGGARLSTVAISPEDSQWLDTRRFGVSEIARFFGVPPHLIADSSNSTSWGSGLAEQNLAFGQFALRPWTERVEEAHTRLLTIDGLPDVFVKLNLDALLRASIAVRYASYETGIASHFLTPNEARALEDLPPLPDGDTFPTNSIPTPSAGGALSESQKQK